MDRKRQQYLDLRNRGQIDLSFIYSFYREKGGTVDYPLFTQIINTGQFNVVSALDKHYGLTILEYSADNKFIKAY